VVMEFISSARPSKVPLLKYKCSATTSVSALFSIIYFQLFTITLQGLFKVHYFAAFSRYKFLPISRPIKTNFHTPETFHDYEIVAEIINYFCNDFVVIESHIIHRQTSRQHQHSNTVLGTKYVNRAYTSF